nr:serine/arginine repetitive matrix protein 2-like [Ipomoea batatas]
MLFLNSEVVQQQKCLLTRVEIDEIHALLRGRVAYKSYEKANLEPPDYGRGEKYELKPIASHTVLSTKAERSQDVVLNKAFAAPSAPRPPRTKVALGVKKMAVNTAPADPPVTDAQTSAAKIDAPSDSITAQTSRSLTARVGAERRRGKSLRSRRLPGMESIMDWSCDRLGEQIAEDILRARALENIREKEVEPLQKQICSVEIKIKELEEELAAAETRSEKVEEEALAKMTDASSIARFICTDEAITKEFLTAFANTEVEDRLIWVYGQCAFTSGCRTMQEQVQTALTEGLEETDLPAVLALLPGEVADPGPKPYAEPGPSK